MKLKVLLLLLLSGLASCAAYKKLTSDNKVSATGGLKFYDGSNPDKMLELITKNRVDALESMSIKKEVLNSPLCFKKKLEEATAVKFCDLTPVGAAVLSKSFGSFDVLLKKGGIYQKALVKNDREIPILHYILSSDKDFEKYMDIMLSNGFIPEKSVIKNDPSALMVTCSMGTINQIKYFHDKGHSFQLTDRKKIDSDSDDMDCFWYALYNPSSSNKKLNYILNNFETKKVLNGLNLVDVAIKAGRPDVLEMIYKKFPELK